MRREPTFAERISFRQTSLVSSNESRFIKWVSLCQTSLVSWNEPRFDSFRFSWTNESRWKSFIEWLINRDDLKSSGFPETVSNPTSLVSSSEFRFDSFRFSNKRVSL